MAPMRLALSLLSLGIASAQDPYIVAANHYHLLFENAFVRATRVTYGPHETAPVHRHPSTPMTIYVYVTDGGAMRFRHVTGEHVAGLDILRKPVQAGGIRFARGMPETHSVEYLGDTATEYVRIELRTDPAGRPARDVRLPPPQLDPTRSAATVQYENGQARIVRIVCASGERCPPSAHPANPAVVVTLSGPQRGATVWSAESAAGAPLQGPLEQVRIELKTRPLNPPVQ